MITRQRILQAMLVIAFAACLGHFIWNVWVGPPPIPTYQVEGDGVVLIGPDDTARQLYLRRMLYLTQAPRRAWLQVIGQDRIRVYVNGRLVGEKTLDGFQVALVADLTPHLTVGKNVIAVAARQSSIDRPPAIAISGAYELSDGEHTISADDEWRCGNTFERGADWWIGTNFNAGHWPPSMCRSQAMRATVTGPPRAITTRDEGYWITPETTESGSACVSRRFEVAGRPRQGWLRLSVAGAYRLAVNGVSLDQEEDQIATTVPLPPVRRIYDITSMLHAGTNSVVVLLTATSGPPHLRADLEVEAEDGQRASLASDDRWLSRPGLPSDWLTVNDGLACRIEAGNLALEPGHLRSQTMTLNLPKHTIACRTIEEIGLILLIALLTAIASRLASQLLGTKEKPSRAAYLSLLPATLGLFGAILATYDPRIYVQDVYRQTWIELAIISVLLQWALLAFVRPLPSLRARVPQIAAVIAETLLLVGLVAAGFVIRVRDIETQPLHWDEVEIYRNTLGIFERGFPSVKFADLPPANIHTSELMFGFTGLAALVFDDARYILRFPSICFSALTILLIYATGRRLFNRQAAWIAAVMFTFAPAAISMANFGRYFAQLQFLTLLVAYFYWETVRGVGKVRHVTMWFTVAGFVGMFLSWEASALIAPSLILAAVVKRQGRMLPLLTDRKIWLGMIIILVLLVLQQSHVILSQTCFMWYGVSLSDVSLKPMWRTAIFQPWYYVWESSWNQDMLLPMAGLVGSILLACSHAWRRQMRFLLAIFLGNCFTMGLLLPNIQWRYIYHMMPLLILLNAAALAAFAHTLVRLGTRGAPWSHQLYSRGIGLLTVALIVALAGGELVQLTEMRRLRIEGYGRLTTFKFPNLAGPAEYLRTHMLPGDIVLSNDPQHLHYFIGGDNTSERDHHYWLASRLFLPATIDDRRTVPLDRRDGSVRISSREELELLFARHSRIWYVAQPGLNSSQNTLEVSAFLRNHMEVVYEDWQSLVLIRSERHRSAAQRQQDDESLRAAGANFLP